MRRLAVPLIALLAITALAVGLGVAKSRTSRSAVEPLIPKRGHVGASADAHLLAAPLGTFGWSLLAQEAHSTPGNVVISPLSIHDVLAMILNGARGQTATEMRQALELGSLPLIKVDQGYGDLIAAAQAGRNPAIQIANSLWLKDGIAFNKAFLRVNRDFYAAGARPLPGDPTEAAAAINGWVERRTNALIKHIVDPSYFTDRTILALVNTVHLKTTWTMPFDPDKTGSDPFRLTDGSQVPVPMMSGFLTAPIAVTKDYQAVALATKGPVTVWVVVPAGSRTPEDLVQSFRSGGFDVLASAAQPQAVNLVLPRLTTSFSEPDLKPALEALGMRRAFSPDRAELGGIVAPGTLGNVYIQRVVHKAVLIVNENGIEAAAATVGIVGATGMPYAPLTIRADHPFLIVVTAKTSGAPLFLALIRDPRS